MVPPRFLFTQITVKPQESNGPFKEVGRHFTSEPGGVFGSFNPTINLIAGKAKCIFFMFVLWTDYRQNTNEQIPVSPKPWHRALLGILPGEDVVNTAP